MIFLGARHWPFETGAIAVALISRRKQAWSKKGMPFSFPFGLELDLSDSDV